MKKHHLAFHIFIIFFLLLLAIISEYSGFDIYVASHFYDAIHHRWPYRSTYITEILLHDMGKEFVVFLLLANIMAVAASYFHPRVTPYKKVLLFFLLSIITGPIIVSILKSVTHIYTPWTLEIFNAHRPYVRIFDSAPAGLPTGHAFPGGHSSGGFAFIALYLYALSRKHSHRYYALAFPLLIGGVFAIDQEVRGAHFLSHDLVSLAICWFSALFWFLIFYGLDNKKD